MPKRFQFYPPHSVIPRFECDLQSGICPSLTKTGLQCKRRTIIGLPFCWSHTLSHRNVRVKDSTIPNSGKGLFAINKQAAANAILFRNLDFIVEYDGEFINKTELERRYGDYTAPYAGEITPTRFEDGACRRGIGTIGNYRQNFNAVLDIDENAHPHRLIVRASKIIRNGQEIFIDYGSQYLMNEGTTYKTKNVRNLKPNFYSNAH